MLLNQSKSICSSDSKQGNRFTLTPDDYSKLLVVIL